MNEDLGFLGFKMIEKHYKSHLCKTQTKILYCKF